MAQIMCKSITQNGIAAEAIHGDKSQNARQRVLEALRIKKLAFS
jgi:ATP-dependent RNA helicase RhlE